MYKRIIVRLQKIEGGKGEERLSGAGRYGRYDFSEIAKEEIKRRHPVQNAKSFIFSFEPEEDNIRELRGSFYGIMEIKSSNYDFDLSIVQKVAEDVLEGAYYGSLDGPPLPALERAVLQAKEKIYSISEEYNTNIEFNLTGCVLWGKVLYLVKLGEGNFYLLRSGNIKEILEGSRAEVAQASGIIEESDVVIVTSPAFTKNVYEKDKSESGEESILKNLDSLDSLVKDLPDADLISVLILKFNTEEFPDERDLLKISIPKIDASKKYLKRLRSVLTEVKFVSLLKDKFSKLFKLIPPPPFARKGIGVELYVPAKKDFSSPRSKRTARLRNTVFLLGTILLLSVVYTVGKQRKENIASAVQEVASLSDQNINSASQLVDLNNAKARDLLNSAKKEIIGLRDLGIESPELDGRLNEINNLLDRVNRVREVNSTPYFELPNNAKIANLVFEEDGLYVLDKGENKLYTVSTTGEKAVGAVKDIPFSDPVGVGLIDNVVLVGSKSGGYFYKGGGFEKEFSIDEEDSSFTALSTYFGNVYLLVPARNQIAKYYSSGDNFVKTDWIKRAEDIQNSVSMTIDGDIYILKGEGQVLKLTQGEREEFPIINLSEPFSDPVYIYTNPDLQFVYILDRGLRKVIVISKDGYYNSQIRLDGEESVWSSLVSMTADSGAGYLYVSTDNKIWRISME